MAVKFILDDEVDPLEDASIMDIGKASRADYLNANFNFSDEFKMWVLVSYSNFTGSLADIANATHLLYEYDGIVAQATGKMGVKSVGIPLTANLNNIDEDSWNYLLKDADFIRRTSNGILDVSLFKKAENHAINAAMKLALPEFYEKIIEKFPTLADRISENEDLLLMFMEDAQSGPGLEWEEIPGGQVRMSVDSMLAWIKPARLKRWLDDIDAYSKIKNRSKQVVEALLDPDDPDPEGIQNVTSSFPIALARDMVKKQLHPLPFNDGWYVYSYNKNSCTMREIVNAATLSNRYPFIEKIKRDNGQIDRVLPEKAIDDYPDDIPDLLMDIETARRNQDLDQTERRARMLALIENAWNEVYSVVLITLLRQRFPHVATKIEAALSDPAIAYKFYEPAKTRARVEWLNSPGEDGGESIIDIKKVADEVRPDEIISLIKRHELHLNPPDEQQELFGLNDPRQEFDLNEIDPQREFGLNDPRQESTEYEIDETQSEITEAREFSCLMAPAPPKLADAIISWGKMFVPEDEIYEDPEGSDHFGREDEIHVTVKFGLHEVSPSDELLRIVEETQPFEIQIGSASFFEGADYDVLKFDVQSQALTELNRRVSALPNSDEHPDYHAHMTVAYVKKGSCRELNGKPLFSDDTVDQDLIFLVKALLFSNKNKEKTTLFVGKPNCMEA
jgi:2'-5' RNA ligase